MRSIAMQSLTNDYKAAFPGVTVWGKGDLAHQDHPSDHNEDDTAGSKPAQTDADTTAEHRAIDIPLGPAFNREQALATINKILANPLNRKRLRYINFENTQWHRNNNFEPHDNSDDPHPTHVHHSGQAEYDEDGSPWFGADMSYEQTDRDTATADTWRLLTILEDRPAAEYQLLNEPAPRNEPNKLRERLIRMEDVITEVRDALVGQNLPVTLTDAQLETLADKVAAKLRTLQFVAQTEE